MPDKTYSVRVLKAKLEDCLADGIDSLSESEVEVILLDRDAQQRNEAVEVGQTCPSCLGIGVIGRENMVDAVCARCNGTGHV